MGSKRTEAQLRADRKYELYGRKTVKLAIGVSPDHDRKFRALARSRGLTNRAMLEAWIDERAENENADGLLPAFREVLRRAQGG